MHVLHRRVSGTRRPQGQWNNVNISSCPCRLGDLEVAGEGMMLPPRMIMTNPMFVTVSSTQAAESSSSLVLPAQCTQGFIVSLPAKYSAAL